MDFQRKRNFIVNFVYYLLWILIIYFLYNFVAFYLFPFIIGLIIAYLVQKPAAVCADKTKISKKIYASFFSVLFYLMFFFVLFLIIWCFYLQVQKFTSNITKELSFFDLLSKNIDQIVSKLGKTKISSSSFNNLFVDALYNFFNKVSSYFTEIFASFFKKIPSFLITSIITIVATFFLAKDYDSFYIFFKGFISNDFYNKIIDIKKIAVKNIKSICLGYFWIYLITYSELLLGFYLLGVKNILITAFITSFIDLLPIFGTGIILIPWAIIEIFLYNFNTAIGIIILYLIIVIVKNFIEPKVIGKQIGINPLFTLVFIFLGLKIGGIIGMITLPFVLTVAFNYLREKYMTVI